MNFRPSFEQFARKTEEFETPKYCKGELSPSLTFFTINFGLSSSKTLLKRKTEILLG